MKIGIAQIEIVFGDKAGNRWRLRDAIVRAGEARCDLCLLPETPLSGWTSHRARRHAEKIPGSITAEWSRLAKLFSMNLVGGIEELSGKNVFNSAVVINRHGRIVSVHRKINELEMARKYYAAGRDIHLTEIDGESAGVNICADNWTPHSAGVLQAMGARMLFSPCAWAVEPGSEKTNLAWIKARYREVVRAAPLWIITSNGCGRLRTGPWKGRNLQGNSLVIDPTGRTFFQATSASGLFIVELPNPKDSRQFRGKGKK
jgi:predicted amidohydrolase